MTTSKMDLRRTLRARRAALSEDANWRADLLVHTLFVADHVTKRLGDARRVAAYVADRGEVDPTPILLVCIERGIELALPHVAGREGPMTFRDYKPGDPLVVGELGILQPADDAPLAAPDLILTPLVGFDRRLNRLGQGAGFYDRALADQPAVRRYGLAWAMQEVEALPTNAWDVPLHGIATEREWIGA